MRENHSRLETRKKFQTIRQQTELLCRPLSIEEQLVASTDETSPPKWHLAHTTWFFDFFVLKNVGPYDYFFNSYYESLGSFLPKKDRRLLSRPSSAEIMDYRHHVTESVLARIETCDEKDWKALHGLIELGMNHEQQHQELLMMDILQNNDLHPSKPAYSNEVKNAGEETTVDWIHVDAQKAEIGTDDLRYFHYDNEGGKHSVWLEPFSFQSRLVSNGEYLEFIESRGYEVPGYWLSDGWEHLKKTGWQAPQYWKKENQKWKTMSFEGIVDLDLHKPVSHLSYYEAQAYAAFRKCRLPTEFEFETVAKTKVLANACPDLNLNLWQWTQSAYLPYPRYQAFQNELAEYNSKFMCNQMVLRGGCEQTPADHYRHTYRNFYYPQQRWQFSGLRLAKDQL